MNSEEMVILRVTVEKTTATEFDIRVPKSLIREDKYGIRFASLEGARKFEKFAEDNRYGMDYDDWSAHFSIENLEIVSEEEAKQYHVYEMADL